MDEQRGYLRYPAIHDDAIVFHNHTAGERVAGAEAVRAHIAAIFARWPTLRFERRSLRCAEDFAVSEWTARAEHPDDGRRLGFYHFGDGTMIQQPHATLLGVERIWIGADTLVASGATLAAVPEADAADDGEPIISIGSRVWAAPGLSIVAHRRVEIGDDVWFGPGVYITDAGHDPSDPDIPIGHRMEPAEPVRIGDGSWLGTGVVVLPGVTIGDHVTVGANAVVCDDLPSYTVAVGSPARVVRHVGEGAPLAILSTADRDRFDEATGEPRDDGEADVVALRRDR